jgi:hypothetical protein
MLRTLVLVVGAIGGGLAAYCAYQIHETNVTIDRMCADIAFRGDHCTHQEWKPEPPPPKVKTPTIWSMIQETVRLIHGN